jgi:hypothetical protein
VFVQGECAIYRTRGIEQPIDDGPGSPIDIWIRTGRRPLLAGGNADGDAAMLATARFGLLIRHDDAGPASRPGVYLPAPPHGREVIMTTGGDTTTVRIGTPPERRARDPGERSDVRDGHAR